MVATRRFTEGQPSGTVWLSVCGQAESSAVTTRQGGHGAPHGHEMVGMEAVATVAGWLLATVPAAGHPRSHSSAS